MVKFDQLYCINEWLANDVSLVSKILLGYKEDKPCQSNFDQDHQILVLS